MNLVFIKDSKDKLTLTLLVCFILLLWSLVYSTLLMADDLSDMVRRMQEQQNQYQEQQNQYQEQLSQARMLTELQRINQQLSQQRADESLRQFRMETERQSREIRERTSRELDRIIKEGMRP